MFSYKHAVWNDNFSLINKFFNTYLTYSLFVVRSSTVYSVRNFKIQVCTMKSMSLSG
jgi:hypothetical protein